MGVHSECINWNALDIFGMWVGHTSPTLTLTLELWLAPLCAKRTSRWINLHTCSTLSYDGSKWLPVTRAEVRTTWYEAMLSRMIFKVVLYSIMKSDSMFTHHCLHDTSILLTLRCLYMHNLVLLYPAWAILPTCKYVYTYVLYRSRRPTEVKMSMFQTPPIVSVTSHDITNMIIPYKV